MKKIIAFVVILCFSLLVFTSCSNGESSFTADYPLTSDIVSNGYSDSLIEENIAEDSAETEEARKIVKTYHLTLETKKFAEDCAFIASEAEKSSGYIASSSVSGNSLSNSAASSRSARYTVRIPSKSADSYVALISQRCNVISSSLTTEDITESYYGVRAQIESLVIQENNLLAMLEKTTNLNDMIVLGDKLSDIRAQINELNYKLQNMDKSADYSYIYISLKEVMEYQSSEKSYWQELGETIVDSAKNFMNVLGKLLILFIWIFPFVAVISMVTIVIIVATNRSKRKKNKKQNEQKD